MFQASGAFIDLKSPNNQEIIGKIQYANSSDIQKLLKSLKASQKKMHSLKPFERNIILKKVAQSIQEHTQELAHLIALEGGKPLKDAKVEVARAQNTIELCAEETLRLAGEMIPMERNPTSVDHLAFTMNDPIGPVLAISAFNHPLNLLAHQVGCAIAAGCMVVIKPAPATPLCAYKLEEYFVKAGLPQDCIAVVNAEVSEIEQLTTSSEFNYITFIGSARVGWHLRKIIAPGTRLALEHGGQAPALVRADADLNQTVSSLIKSSFYHAGQVCISTQRIFVQQDLFDEFIDKFLKETQKLKVGSALEESTDIGPLIRGQEVERIQSWINEAIKSGAKILYGNEVSGNRRQYLSPTILINVPRETKIMSEEVFGPVVCINPYEDEKELLEYLNSSDYIFEASLFTQNIQEALRIARDFSTMTLVINNHNAFRVDWMPFGGHKLSGLGMGGVKYMIHEMTRLKQVIIKL
ncbi:MAG: aldehyde dehydrogenase family protein [Bacteriovoracaceae bacterium]